MSASEGVSASEEELSPNKIPVAERGGARWRTGWSLPEVRWAAGATVLFSLGIVAQVSGGPAWLYWALYLSCYAVGGWRSADSGLRALWEKTLDVDLLMVLAAIGAAAIEQVFDGGLLIVIFAVSGAMEAVATKRTEDSVRGLLDLTPDRATLITTSGEETVDTARIEVGDLIVVRPGERIGADGDVVGGASEVDQATITGESVPVAKKPADEVFAGTVNGTGMLRVRASRPANETVVARIVEMVREASATKARTQLFIEKIEQRYSVGMVAATLALFVLPLLFGADVESTLLRAMTFMIVASPCAVVLATMPPLLSSIANAGRHGVLVKSSVVQEKLGSVTRVAFDKTGTLTEGRPRVSEIRTLSGTGLDDREVLALAAAAENPSRHPLAQALVNAAEEATLSARPTEEFSSVPGRGVSARVGGRLVEVGSPAALLEDAGQSGEAGELVTELESAGQTVIVVRVDDSLVGVVGLADQLRADAIESVARLTELTGARPLLLTGDNARTAARIASEVGMTEIHAGLGPEDKVHLIQELEQRGEKVLLVGDGVNDAPALAAAHAGIAMGHAGCDLALDTADAVVVRDELGAIPTVLNLARRAQRLVVANLVIAATFISGLVAWDLLGWLPLILGVAGHEGSTVLVGLNGLRLLREKAWLSGKHPRKASPRERPPRAGPESPIKTR